MVATDEILIRAAILVVAMLILSAFFSGMEMAFVSKNRLKLEIDRKQNRLFDRIAAAFSRHPGQFVTTILVGNNISLVVYSLYMSLLIRHLADLIGLNDIAHDGSVVIETAISTLIIIFFAEYIPKTVFKNSPNFYYRTFSVIMYGFYLLLYPISRLTTMLSYLILRLMGRKVRHSQVEVSFDHSDLASLLNSTSDISSEGDNEIKIFQNALDFADMRVRDCMVPRVDIVGVDITASMQELTDRFVESKYSRIFVWEGSLDNIVGYVNSKSLFFNPESVGKVTNKVTYVAETMQLQSLLEKFIGEKSNIAVVIDEFGGTSGVISLEDILEQIFGEIEDEHDDNDLIQTKVGEDEYMFSGRLEVKHLNEKYNLQIEENPDYDTLAGYIIYDYGGIPTQGETVVVGSHQFKIVKTSDSRIDLVKVTKLK